MKELGVGYVLWGLSMEVVVAVTQMFRITQRDYIKDQMIMVEILGDIHTEVL